MTVDIEKHEREYALQWVPSPRRGKLMPGSPASSKAARTPGSPKRKMNKVQQSRAQSLEEWFDSGLKKKEQHVEGQVLLPSKYQGAKVDQLLINQDEADVTIWPVRIDIGDLSTGKGLRKTRTLYHYMSQPSFDKAVAMFSKGDADLPLNMLKLIKEDVRDRAKSDSSNLKGEVRVSSLEPALFAHKAAVLQEVLGVDDPQGTDINGVPLEDVADYCLSFRVSNTCAEKAVVEGGRQQVTLSYDELVKQCFQVTGQKVKATKISDSGEEGEEDEENQKTWLGKWCGCLRYDRKKALKRAGHTRQQKPVDRAKEAKILEFETEHAYTVRDKKTRLAMVDAVEDRRDGIINGRNRANGNVSSPASPQGKRGSMTAVAAPSHKPKEKKKGGLAGIQVEDFEIDISNVTERHEKTKGASNMKLIGSRHQKDKKRASVVELRG